MKILKATDEIFQNLQPDFRDVGAFSKVGPRLVQLRFGVSAARNRLEIVSKSLQNVYIQKPRNPVDVWSWMRLVQIFPGIAIAYGVAPGVVWKDSTAVVHGRSL